MAFYYGGGRRALPSMAYSRPGSTQMGLLADELWPVPQSSLSEARSYGVRRAAPRDEPVETSDTSADDSGDDEPTGLPASVINQYRERLEQEGLDFLAHGPRTFEDQLAYAQWVRPNAYRNSRPASLEEQLRFRQSRDVDWANNFVGPDGIVYVRDHAVGEEKPEARVFRAYEKMVGGFKRPKLDELLDEFDLPDPREGYSPETKAKVAEVEQFDRPISTDEKAWRAWAREQDVNPLTWFMAEKMPESYQDNYQFGIARDMAPAWGNSVFVGPDGIVYRQNKLTRPDRATAVSKGLEYLWSREALRDAPIEEVVDRAFAAGATLPGPNFGRATPVAPRYAGLPGRVTQELTDWVQSSKLRPFVRNPFGGKGKPETRKQLSELKEQILRANPTWKHVAGGSNREKAVPGLFGSNRGSYRGDLIFETPAGRRVVVETTDVDARGKERDYEWEKSLWGFLRGAGDVYNIPKDPGGPKTYGKEHFPRGANILKHLQMPPSIPYVPYEWNTLWWLLSGAGNITPRHWQVPSRDPDDDPRR